MARITLASSNILLDFSNVYSLGGLQLPEEQTPDPEPPLILVSDFTVDAVAAEIVAETEDCF